MSGTWPKIEHGAGMGVVEEDLLGFSLGEGGG